MSVEEVFRGHESRRTGQSLRHTRFTRFDRFGRSLLAVALADIVLAGAGLRAKLDFDPSAWCTNRRGDGCGAFTTGKAPIDRLNCEPDQLLQMIRGATIEVGSKWG